MSGPVSLQDLPPVQSLVPGPVDAALKQGRPVLVDFSASWCPPCDRLRDEFLHEPRWEKLLSSFSLVVLDADDPSSFPAKERYQVGAYPTLLVLSQDGQILDRMVGFDGASRTAERLKSLLAGSPGDASSASLLAVRRLLASGEQAAAWKQLRVALGIPPAAATGSFDETVLPGFGYELLALGAELSTTLAPESSVLLARAAAEVAPSPGLAAGHVDSGAQVLDQLGRAEEAESLRSAFEERLAAVVGARSLVTLTIAEDSSSLDAELFVHPSEVQTDYARAAWYRAQWAANGDRRLLFAEAAIRLAASVLMSPHATREESRGGTPRRLSLPDSLLQPELRNRLYGAEGAVHDLLTALGRAGLPDVAEPIGDTMVELFPKSFSWHFRRAGFRLEHRNGEGAVASARLALKHSYGDNHLRACHRLGRALLAVGRPGEAVEVLEDGLAQRVPEEQRVRTHRYREQLSVLLASARAELGRDEVRPREGASP